MEYHPQSILRRITRQQNDLTFSENAIVHWLTIAAGLFGLASLTILALNIQPEDALIRLQYNIYFGASVFGEWWKAYSLSLMGISFFLIDLFLAAILYHIKHRIAAYMILIGLLFSQAALLVAVISIVLNNS